MVALALISTPLLGGGDLRTSRVASWRAPWAARTLANRSTSKSPRVRPYTRACMVKSALHCSSMIGLSIGLLVSRSGPSRKRGPEEECPGAPRWHCRTRGRWHRSTTSAAGSWSVSHPFRSRCQDGALTAIEGGAPATPKRSQKVLRCLIHERWKNKNTKI